MSTRQSFWTAKTVSWISLILGLAILLGLGFIFVPNGPTPYPAYVAKSPSPSGVKAFYSLLKKDFTHVDLWQKPAQALPPSASHQLMIMVEPSSPLNPNELEEWTKWLEAGNRIWLVMLNPQGLFDLQTTPSAKSAQPETLIGSGPWQGNYQATLQTDVRLEAGPKDQVLLRDQNGVVALARAYGQGELTVLLAPDWLTNGQILKQDHLQLLLPFITRAEPQVIWLNDYIHGYSNLPTVFGVYPEWFLILLAQLAISCLLWLWYKGKRFGSIQTPREWVVRFGDERIRAMAAWYEKGRFYKESLRIQAEFLRQTVQARWGIPVNLEGQEFLEAARHRMPPETQTPWLQNWPQLTENLMAKKISPQTYLKWSQILNEMQKEVEHR